MLFSLLSPSEIGIDALSIDQKQATPRIIPHMYPQNKLLASQRDAKNKKLLDEELVKKKKEKEAKEALEAEKKAIEEADASVPADDTKMAISSYNGADEDEIIDSNMADVSREALNPAGVGTGEKIVWKEDAKKASKFIIKKLKGL